MWLWRWSIEDGEWGGVARRVAAPGSATRGSRRLSRCEGGGGRGAETSRDARRVPRASDATNGTASLVPPPRLAASWSRPPPLGSAAVEAAAPGPALSLLLLLASASPSRAGNARAAGRTRRALPLHSAGTSGEDGACGSARQ
ncbi:unnamed protein product [Lampetra planeri]